MSRYHISVDQILHGETMEGKSTERMQFETLLDELTDAEIKILTATAQALLDARTDNEGENWIRYKERYEQVVHGVFLLQKSADVAKRHFSDCSIGSGRNTGYEVDSKHSKRVPACEFWDFQVPYPKIQNCLLG